MSVFGDDQPSRLQQGQRPDWIDHAGHGNRRFGLPWPFPASRHEWDEGRFTNGLGLTDRGVVRKVRAFAWLSAIAFAALAVAMSHAVSRQGHGVLAFMPAAH